MLNIKSSLSLMMVVIITYLMITSSSNNSPSGFFVSANTTSSTTETPTTETTTTTIASNTTAPSASINCAVFDPCAPHGACINNACVCDSEALKGYWVGSDCKECDVGWAGVDCNIECGGGYNNICSGHGTCSAGVAGSGNCVCAQGWTGPSCDMWAANTTTTMMAPANTTSNSSSTAVAQMNTTSNATTMVTPPPPMSTNATTQEPTTTTTTTTTTMASTTAAASSNNSTNETTTPSPILANIYTLVIAPILAGSTTSRQFTQVLAANLTGLGRVEFALVADVARKINVPPTDITVVNIVYNSVGEMFFQMNFKNAENADGQSVNNLLQDAITGVVTADWLNSTLAQMKQVGAAAGMDVRGAAAAGVISGTTTSAPAEDNQLCFINDDCIISAVVIGVGVLVLIVAVTAIGAKMCGGGNKAEEEARQKQQEQKQQRQYEMERRNSSPNMQRRPSATYDQMMAEKQGGGVLVQPQVQQPAVPQQRPAYTVDDDL